MKRSTWANLVVACAALWFMADANAQNSVRCESDDGRYQSCPVDTRGGVTLSRQLSSHGCWQGDTWGFDRNRIWVTNGCRAEFNVGRAESSSSSSNALAAAAIVALVGAAAIAPKKHHDRHDGRNDDELLALTTGTTPHGHTVVIGEAAQFAAVGLSIESLGDRPDRLRQRGQAPPSPCWPGRATSRPP